MAQPPAEIWLLRIVHFENLEYILRHGMHTRGHPQQDPNYIFIGDQILTNARDVYPVPLAGWGNLGDYVPFYFWPLSPMLLKIKTGHGGIVQRPQRDIIYVCCRLQDVQRTGQPWLFTDGQAKALISRFFTDLTDLDRLDWNAIRLRYWPDVEDTDRQRRKQAEFLVKETVLPECISRVVVFDEQQRTFVMHLLQQIGHPAEVSVNPNNQYYFH